MGPDKQKTVKRNKRILYDIEKFISHTHPRPTLPTQEFTGEYTPGE